LDFRGHSTLILEREQMLDDRITKNYVHAAVTELSDIPRVTSERSYARVPLFFCDEVQSENLNITALVPAPIFPKRICTADVENT
jgi:hypothetical protein